MRTDEFLNLVKASASIPTGQTTFTDAEILAFATDEIRNEIIPLILGSMEEYLVVSTDTALVSGKSKYSIPPRAIGKKLRELQLVDVNGNVKNLSRIELENTPSYSGNITGEPTGFLLKGNNIILYPTPSQSSNSLRISYYRRPNSLVEVSQASYIAGIDTDTNTLVLSSVSNSSIVAGAKIDLISSQSGHDSLLDSEPVVSLSGTDLILGSLPEDLAVGDYLSLEGESCYLQIPEELVGLVVAKTALRIFEAQSDSAGINAVSARIQKIEQNINSVLSPRVDGEPRKIVSSQNIKNYI